MLKHTFGEHNQAAETDQIRTQCHPGLHLGVYNCSRNALLVIALSLRRRAAFR